ncbi:MAG: F0F1 ATP synthase subunit alpha [Candidatus Roizmanbacteria bacterium]|nr:MAG: F0F1 ATP synthase subunit alpha [Candidatus Roizmanbacteria bacterium]
MKVIDQSVKEIEEEVKKFESKPKEEEIGWATEVRDQIVQIKGLKNVGFGEILVFDEGVEAMVIDMTEDSVGAIVLGDYLLLKAGSVTKATGRTLQIPVTDDILGRVVNPLVHPEDGGKNISSDKLAPVERIAPGVIYRKSVTVPLQTGIKAIDSLIPIGRGQRELIIGDRGTGKTTIAVDAILNQKKENAICIYCAIGQKNSTIASIIELLRKGKALDYTVVVAASASSPATLQYLAPYSATAIGEYFMGQGKDVLIIYDDLTKHAWAYREISLILRRPAGREAFPGDIFYLHSRLLERSCRIDEKYGGGSMTALPIVQTLEGDVSAYIPTNIISITDGQIFLESELFNAGVRPAINVGLSVSRVGSAAQTKAMKQVSGRLKLDLAQYREMAAFSQFESDLDEATKKLLNRGARTTQVLIQGKNKPYDLASEIAVIWAAVNGHLDTVPVDEVAKFEKKYLEDLNARGKALMTRINKNKTLSKEDEEELKKFVKDNIV